MKNFRLLFIAMLLISSSTLRAQVRKSTPFKPPKLTTFIAGYKDSTGISVAEASNIISLPIKITDAKKTEYTISSYQFLYRKKGVTEDEATGKTSPVTSISSERFKVSPLPAIWVETIRSQLKKGEELYFFDVIAKDAQGRVMYSSDLKITIL